MTGQDFIDDPLDALARYEEARSLQGFLDEIPGSLVNRTWSAGTPPRFALQLVAPQFGDAVNARIEAVGNRLMQSRVRSPQLLRTDAGALSLPGPEGWRWRLLTWIPGRVRHLLTSPQDAESAGALLAQFHDVLYRSRAELELPVSDFHDTEARLARLQAALARAGGHAHEGQIRQLGDEILRRYEAWQGRRTARALEPRPGHGDLKISNVIFEPHAVRARALIDYDTLGLYTLDAELGDALRSWCNIAGEDKPRPRFDLAIFDAAIAGYLGTSKTITSAERGRLVHGFGRITLELAARFLTDAVEDCYFDWDAKVAPSRIEHNLLRTQGQLELARHVAALRSDLEAIVRRH